MKKSIVLSFATLLLFGGLQSCKRPTENVQLNINNAVFNNFLYVKLASSIDPNRLPVGTKMTITGPDAKYIYTLAGDKNFKVEKDGTIVLAIDPTKTVTLNNPLEIVINATSLSTLPVSAEITIDGQSKTQHVDIAMADISTPPSGYSFEKKQYTLSDGAISSAAIVSGQKNTADSVYYSDDNTSVVLPAGTDFFSYQWQATGELVSTRRYKATSHSYTENGVEKVGTIYVPYDTMVQAYGYVPVRYNGSYLQVICVYRDGRSVTTSLNAYDDPSEEKTDVIKTLDGNLVKYNELLYDNAARKILSDIYFLGKDKAGNYIQISPNKQTKWFTSYNLDPNMINPLTKQKIKEGDLIEIGIDPSADTTIKTTIKKVPNGQLRVECRTFCVGYFYRAPYTYSYKYTFNRYQPSVIPDIENVFARVSMNFGVLTNNVVTVNPSDYYGNFTASAKLSSKFPINTDDASATLYYCDKVIQKFPLQNNGTLPLFTNSYFANLPNAITFNFTIECLNNKLAVHPDYKATVYARTPQSTQYRTFICNVDKGVWKTRGVNLGETYYMEGYINGYFLRDTLSVDAVEKNITKKLKGDEDICKGL